MSILLEYEFIFELKILSPSEANTRFIEIILKRCAIIFKSIDFPSVEVHIIFSWRLIIDPISYLLL